MLPVYEFSSLPKLFRVKRTIFSLCLQAEVDGFKKNTTYIYNGDI